METKARFTVDADHCQRAADELYAIFCIQQRGFVERWNNARATAVVIAIARWVGLILTLLALLIIGALLYFDTQEWATQPPAWYLAVFFAFFLFFVFTPRIAAGLQRWSYRRAEKTARRQADRCLKQARQLAPYEVELDFKGDLLINMRGKDGVWKLAWSRSLGGFRERGLAVQAESVTVIFKQPNSILPAVVILQRGREWTSTVLQEAGITLARSPLPDQRNP